MAISEALLSEKNNIQEYQQTLDMGEITQFTNVMAARADHLYRHKLWHALEDWENHTNEWKTSPFGKVDIAEISNLSDAFTKTAVQCERNLPGASSAVAELKRLVADFREAMPIV
jgi:hypothetical protein